MSPKAAGRINWSAIIAAVGLAVVLLAHFSKIQGSIANKASDVEVESLARETHALDLRTTALESDMEALADFSDRQEARAIEMNKKLDRLIERGQ